MRELYYVRHGESLWNLEDKICGATDAPLTEKGHEQAVKTGKVISEAGIRADIILYSPLQRAADTARQGELEEAVFTSGTAVGSEEFIRRLVGSEDEAFPTGHKTPPVNFTVGENKLKTLRNLRVLRKK